MAARRRSTAYELGSVHLEPGHQREVIRRILASAPKTCDLDPAQMFILLEVVKTLLRFSQYCVTSFLVRVSLLLRRGGVILIPLANTKDLI